MGFQITAALLDACVLSILARGDTYGYELTQNLRERLQVSESTLYPVLRRLQAGLLLRTYDMPHQGRNRRYYSITEQGTAQLVQFKQDWSQFRDQLNSLLGKEG
ncbi:MAG: PadR family transcriptional regulator [Coriobacteriales bacterium]|jgi:PadR family transcriptional regulator PadR|nr:PadR family transcriptional regulator [Coriobacteriales bacterium]